MSSPRRVAVVVLASMLAPLLVMTMPNVAAAAMPVGSWQKASAVGEMFGPGEISCNVQTRYSTTTSGLYAVDFSSGICLAPFGFQQATEGDPYGVELTGLRPDGSPCGTATSGTFTAHADDSWANELGAMTNDVAVMFVGEGACHVETACFNTNGPGGSSPMSFCAPHNMGAPPAPGPTGTCASGTVTATNYTVAPNHASYGDRGSADITFTGVTTASGWVVHTLWRNPATPTVVTTENGQGFSTTLGASFVRVTMGYAQYSAVAPTLVGVSVRMGNQNRGGWDADDVAPDGLKGRTDPNNCVWYFGEKFFDEAGTTTDNPAGPIAPYTEPVDAPAPEPDTYPEGEGASSCTFSWTDPATWASAGICAVAQILMRVVALLGDVIEAIAAVPAQIMAALGDMLTGLFVPSESFMDGQVSELDGAWDDTSVAKWKDAFTGQAFTGSASGCGGLPVAWSMGGQNFNFTLLAACTGAMVNVAAVIKLILTAGLVIFGGLTCLRALGSGFGWNPGVGRGET